MSLKTLACGVALTLGLAGCGGGSPTSPGPSPTPVVPTYTVTATVYYDQNNNGQLDAGEAVRVPGVDVVIGAGTGKSAPGTGQAVVTGITEGAQSVGIKTDSVPFYFQPQPQPVAAVQVPGASEVRIPLTLPIGNNNANVYLGYGDSITYGDGSSDGQGYVLKLQNLLGPYFGRAQVQSWGRPGTFSSQGANAARVTYGWFSPAYVLIHYGTNDWQDQSCQNSLPTSCFTIDALRGMIQDAKNRDTLPVLSTIIPSNPNLNPPDRNQWYDGMNVQIKALAQQEQVLLCDMNAEFKAQPSLASLYADSVHPNDAGYQVMAQGWFKAITRGRAAAASAKAKRFGFSLH